jgi:uncharacterized protein
MAVMGTVAISGATGLIGHALVRSLSREGTQVRTLSRGFGTTHRWDPGAGTIDAGFVDGARAVVHLAGESIGAGRFDAARKRELVKSRVETTALLVREMERAHARPEVFICASAVGVYGSRGDEWLDETSSVGEGFLAELCVAWEDAASAARALGVRVVNARFGLVLSREGGLLGRLRPLFKAGLGGPIGTGTQWMSFIHLDDAVDAIRFAIERDHEGPLNVVMPRPERNADFAGIYGRVLMRPALLRAPRFALRLALGRETADETALASQRVKPEVLLDRSFVFRHPSLESALREVEGLT